MNIYLKNDGTINTNRVIIDKDNYTITLYFSYETIVGFEYRGEKGHIIETSQNEWSKTTGKYLNAIDGGSDEAKKKRIPHSELLSKLDELMN